MVKLFTIVKDEVVIVKDWIIYHGSLFGWNNIYIIDNYSTDGTYETIMDLKNLSLLLVLVRLLGQIQQLFRLLKLAMGQLLQQEA